MDVTVGVRGGESVSIIHESLLKMCLLAPESKTQRGVADELELRIAIVSIEISSSEIRISAAGAGLRETEGGMTD